MCHHTTGRKERSCKGNSFADATLTPMAPRLSRIQNSVYKITEWLPPTHASLSYPSSRRSWRRKLDLQTTATPLPTGPHYGGCYHVRPGPCCRASKLPGPKSRVESQPTWGYVTATAARGQSRTAEQSLIIPTMVGEGPWGYRTAGCIALTDRRKTEGTRAEERQVQS